MPIVDEIDILPTTEKISDSEQNDTEKLGEKPEVALDLSVSLEEGNSVENNPEDVDASLEESNATVEPDSNQVTDNPSRDEGSGTSY